MLQSFRSHKRWMMFIAMIFIVPSFVVTGIYSYNRMSNTENEIAKVGDSVITVDEFNSAKHRYLENLRRQMGTNFNANMLDSQEARVSILAQLIAERALQLEIAQSHIVVSEADAIAFVKSVPAFQRNGQFSQEAYKQYLNATGKSDEYFVYELRRDLARELLIGAVTNTTMASNTQALRIHDLLTQEREIRTATIQAKRFINDAKVSDEEVAAYYEANKAQFAVEESVDVEYVILSPENYKNITASDEDALTFYEQNLQRFTTAEERRASHILIATKDAKTEEAQKRADALYAELQKNPKKFAALAKANSADPGSAKQGGDLGFFAKGMMVPEFEAAVFGAQKGELLAPVKTDFGYHIILVTDVHAAQVKPMAEVRAEIDALYAQQASLELFATDAEGFSNMVYEQSESLKPVVDQYKLTVHTVNNVKRDHQDKVLNPSVIEALYSFDVLQDKRNTNAIEIAPNTLLAARVVKHHPKSHLTLAEVAGDIKEALTQKAAAATAASQGEETLAALTKGAKILVKFDRAQTVSRENPNSASFEVVNAAMRPLIDTLPAYTGVQTAEGNYVIVQVLKATQKAATEEEIAQRKSELVRIYAMPEQAAFMNALQEKYGVEILKDEYKPDYKADQE